MISLFFLPLDTHSLSYTHTHTHTLAHSHAHTRSTGGVAMVNSQPMPVPGRMAANPTAPAAGGYNMMESGVQPVRTVPNPSYPTGPRPGAPQVKR